MLVLELQRHTAGPIPPLAVEDLPPGKLLGPPRAWFGGGMKADTVYPRLLPHCDVEAGVVSLVDTEYRLYDVDAVHAKMESGCSTATTLLLP
jgi:NADPH2:quinone reductase